MPKNLKQKVSFCPQHQFILNPLESNLHLRQKATVSFCKGKEAGKSKGRREKKKLTRPDCLCCPVFNRDCNHATSSFILPEEQENFIEKFDKLKLEHENRVWEYNEQKSELLIPKPKSRYSYCNVCSSNYTDYLDVHRILSQHIHEQNHKRNINKSKYSRYIYDLQKKYKHMAKPIKSKQKNQETIPASEYFQYQEQEVQEISQPKKRVKMSQQEMDQGNTSKFPSYQQTWPSFYYPNFYHSLPPMQMIPALNSSYPSFGYPLEFGMMGNSYMYWNSSGMFPMAFNNFNFNRVPPCKPVFIDLEASQE